MTAQPTRDQLSKRAGYNLFVLGADAPTATARETCVLLDDLADAEKRATRAEAQAAIRGRAVAIYQQRAAQSEKELDYWMARAYEAETREYQADARTAEEKRLRMKATAAATEAEARVRDLTQEVKDERGAARDQMEQVRIRDARIGRLENRAASETARANEWRRKHHVMAEKRDAAHSAWASENEARRDAKARLRAVEDVLDQAEASINRHPAYTFSGQRMDPIVNGADIRRALDT